MIVIDNCIVSEDLLDKKFVCNLDKCKGACCVEGESGAPLNQEETEVIEKVYDKIKPYMVDDGIATVEKFGKWVIDSDGDFVTPLVGGRGRCAYVFFEKGVAKCAFEKAHSEGKINFQKPISCHLYPVRITEHKEYDAVNYSKWEICSPACSNGSSLGISVFEFVKTGLIRKYGVDWYKQLEGAAEFAKSNVSQKK